MLYNTLKVTNGKITLDGVELQNVAELTVKITQSNFAEANFTLLLNAELDLQPDGCSNCSNIG